jgi:hypothetical protein
LVVKEGGDVSQDLGVVGEDVDVVQIGQDEPMRSQMSREAIQKGSYAQAEEERSKGVTLSDPLRREQEVLLAMITCQYKVSC